MNKNKVLCLLIFVLMLLTGCGPSLKEYVAQSSSYSSSTAAKTKVSVIIEPNDVVPEGRGVMGSIGSAVNIASSVSAMAVSHEQEIRLQNLIHAENITAQVASGFDNSFANTTHLQIVDNSANPDLRVMMNVTGYGLWAQSILDPINFYIECEVQIIHTASMERIYSNTVYVRREASNLFSEISNSLGSSVTSSRAVRYSGLKTTYAVDSVASLVSGAANLSAFFELTDEQIMGIFDYMAYDAGYSVASQLIDAIYR